MSTSAAQYQANRTNALKSSGPRTSEGKAVSAMNAVRHGLRANSPVLAGCEDAATWERLLNGLIEDHQPVGTTELLLVEQLASARWRAWRANAFENGALEAEGAAEVGLGRSSWKDGNKGATISLALKYRRSAESSFMSALRELQRLQAARQGVAVPLPIAVEVSVVSDGTDLPEQE